jgi:YidC/Oxa1 family membrane protein insertase
MQEEKSFGFFQLAMWALLVFAAFRFFGRNTQAESLPKECDVPSQKFKIITSSLEREPVDKALPINKLSNLNLKKTITIATDLCLYQFNVETAALKNVAYKSIKDQQGVMVDSLGSLLADTKQQQSWPSLVFLPHGNALPIFSLKEKRDLLNKMELEFKAESSLWDISKVFILEKNSYKITLQIKVLPKDTSKKVVLRKPRLIFSAPTKDLTNTAQDQPMGVSSDTGYDFLKVSATDEPSSAWKKPYLFGAEDRFFLHTFVGSKTESHFLRGYYDRPTPDSLTVFLEMAPITKQTEQSFDFYFGPKKIADLVAVNQDLEKVLSFGIWSSLCKVLLSILEALNNLVHNYGFAIILLALLLRIPFWPLVVFSRRRMRSFELFEQQHAAEIADINRRYASSIVAKNEHIAKFYADKGISQWGKLFVVLPEILQFPIVYALYKILTNYISLYNAPFIFWIHDLSARDPYFVMPLFMAFCFFLQQSTFNPMPQEKTLLLKYGIPLVMFVVFFKMPTGLVLYWLVKMLLGILEELSFRLLGKKLDY